MDIGRDHASECDVARAGHHRRKEAVRTKESDQAIQGETGLGAQPAGLPVEAQDSVREDRTRDHVDSARRQGRVTVGAAEAPGEPDVAGDRFEILGENFARRCRHAPPAAHAWELAHLSALGIRQAFSRVPG